MVQRQLAKGTIWRWYEDEESVKLQTAQHAAVDQVAQLLAQLSRVPLSLVQQKVAPRTDEDLQEILHLAKSFAQLTFEQLSDAITFVKTFLKFVPADYQAELLRATDKRIAIRFSRQSGKTLTFAAKAIYYCVTHPNSLVMIVASNLDQSMVTSERLATHLSNMPIAVHRAWIKEQLKTIIRFSNGSTIRAMPYSLHRLRGKTCDLIFVDEAAFIREDQVLFQSVLEPMFATREKWQMVVSSTPWGKDSMFWKFCKDPKVSKLWKQFHIPWKKAMEADVIKKDFMDERLQEVEAGVLPLQDFQREYEAEFVEDVDTWLTQDLITKCIDHSLQYGTKAEIYWHFDEYHRDAELYMGLDLGKRVDHSAVAVFEKVGEDIYLRHVHLFPLDTPYASVIGYVKVLSERWLSLVRVCVDKTGADYVVEDMVRSGIPGIRGIMMSLPGEEEIMTFLRQKMSEMRTHRVDDREVEVSRVHIPYDPQLINQLNVEKYELTKDGHIRFSHPTGTHDDILWAFALGIWGSKVGAGTFRISGVPKIL